MSDHPDSSGTSGDRRQRKWWKRWIPSRRAQVLLAYVVVRLVFILVRLLYDD